MSIFYFIFISFLQTNRPNDEHGVLYHFDQFVHHASHAEWFLTKLVVVPCHMKSGRLRKTLGKIVQKNLFFSWALRVPMCCKCFNRDLVVGQKFCWSLSPANWSVPKLCPLGHRSHPRTNWSKIEVKEVIVKSQSMTDAPSLLVLDTGTDIPGGYAGRGTLYMDTDTLFCTQPSTRTCICTRHTRTYTAGLAYKYILVRGCRNNIFI